MGLRFKKCNIYMDSTNWTVPDREYLDLNKEKMQEYIKTHPMPKNNTYSFGNPQEAIDDITESQGAIIIDFDESQEFINWLEGLLSD